MCEFSDLVKVSEIREKIKNVSKEVLRNSGIPVLDYQYTDNCDIDDLRRKIANLLNPLNAKVK